MDEGAGILMQEQPNGYAEEEYEYELSNRLKNLLWTVSGDYELDMELDVRSFQRSKYISLYDAVKQGAFARYFSQDDFGLYLVKKLYLGADEAALVNLAQMCVDQAVTKKVAKERKGVISLRKKAFADILTGRIKIAMLQEGIDGTYSAEKRIREQAEALFALQDAACTMDVIQEVDAFYNRLVDPEFEAQHGGLAQVLAVSAEDLKQFDWQDFLNESSRYSSSGCKLLYVLGSYGPAQVPGIRRGQGGGLETDGVHLFLKQSGRAGTAGVCGRTSGPAGGK